MKQQLVLNTADQILLEEWTKAYGTPQQVALRCRIVLGAISGESNLRIAQRLDVNRLTVALWLGRAKNEGIGSLWHIASGRGRKPVYNQQKRDRIIAETLKGRPKGQTHWSCRTMAKAAKVSVSTVNRL
jgi:transposase